ncbi:MAG: molybdate ABC transporter substrate-binding protein [Pseudomonadota bacterium]
MRLVSIFLFCLLVADEGHAAEPLTVAVASNFRVVAEALAEDFANTTGNEIRLSSGSTGKLYGQILNGAPFDVFLAADRERPELLEAAGHVAEGSRRIYAVGHLALVSMSARECEVALLGGDGRIAIANPDVAPFGAAAMSALSGAYHQLVDRDRLVFAENVAQVMHFVVTGNAEVGLVSTAQIAALEDFAPSCTQTLRQDVYEPVVQQAVILKRTQRLAVATAFFEFLHSDQGRAKIQAFGYGVR